eukprot:3941701-Rhodomonas_salina.5
MCIRDSSPPSPPPKPHPPPRPNLIPKPRPAGANSSGDSNLRQLHYQRCAVSTTPTSQCARYSESGTNKAYRDYTGYELDTPIPVLKRRLVIVPCHALDTPSPVLP